MGYNGKAYLEYQENILWNPEGSIYKQGAIAAGESELFKIQVEMKEYRERIGEEEFQKQLAEWREYEERQAQEAMLDAQWAIEFNKITKEFVPKEFKL